MGKSGRVIEDRDESGAIFAPVPGKAMRPAYSYGPEQTARHVMFTCPQSAIPLEVWQVLTLWNACRLTRTLPKAGGLLDQPVLVQRYFPVLDMEFQRATAGQGGAEQAALLAVGAVMKVVGGR